LSSTAVPAPRDAVIPEFTTPPRSRSAHPAVESRLFPLALLAVCLAYVGWRLGHGWIAVDDGTLGHTAERVLHGELPHRDFDDVYTGGLAYLNAIAFRLLGTTLWTLRVVLLVFFAAWVPAVYYVARRFVRPPAAGAVTLLAIVWSVPNYPAAMPSWYNLFFATFGVAAVFRYLEDGRSRWLMAAGVAGGMSFLVKVIGLYYVAGVLLFLVYQAHAASRAHAGLSAERGSGYALFATGALIAFVGVLMMVVRQQLHTSEVVQFVLPGALVAAFLVRSEWTIPAGGSRARFVELGRLLAPFAAGVSIPIALFLVPYATSGSLGAFANGVFFLPMKRFGVATMPMLSLWTAVALLPLVVLFVGARAWRARSTRWWLTILVPSLVALFAATLWTNGAYRFVWYSGRNLLPLLVAVGVAVVARSVAADSPTSPQRARLMLLLSVTALCTLVQFPYSAANYFCYVAPLVVLTAAALLDSLPPVTPTVPAALVAFYAAFAVTRVNGSPAYLMGERYIAPLPVQPLALPRGGIDVPNYMAPAYRAVVGVLRRHARGGYTWASPDCPEIYFLSGLRNPTRSIFEFFDDQHERTKRVLGALDRHGVTAVVLHREVIFSQPFTPDLIAGLEQRYPYAADFGPFQVRWQR
jgi:hypothetical protein